jgi:hypothetical protein
LQNSFYSSLHCIARVEKRSLKKKKGDEVKKGKTAFQQAVSHSAGASGIVMCYKKLI